MTRSVPDRSRRRDGMGAIDAVTIYDDTGTIFSDTLNLDTDGLNGYTVVAGFAVAALSLPPGAITRMRITFEAGAGQALTITNAYIGHAAGAGDAYDFAAAPTQILFSGGAVGAMIAGASLTSDWISFAYNKTSPLLIAFYMGAGVANDNAHRKIGVANVSQYDKVANDAATVNKTGYATTAGSLLGVKKIESDGY